MKKERSGASFGPRPGPRDRRGAVGVTARAVTSAPALTVTADDSIRRAAELMVAGGAGHLVVVKRGRPVGVISTLDLARALADGLSS